MTDFAHLNLIKAIENYGYEVRAEPLAGHEADYTSWLNSVLAKIQHEANTLRNEYGYRGRSGALIAHLHRTMPFPDWGVHTPEDNA